MPIVRKRLTPTSYIVTGDCGSKCTLNIDNVGSEWAAQILAWYDEGLNDLRIEDRCREKGLHISHGSIGRHRANHMVKRGEQAPDEALTELDDVEALDLIIKRGQAQIKNWKLTPSEYFKAMDMKYKLTQGSTMDAMFAAMAAAATDRDEPSEDDAETED